MRRRASRKGSHLKTARIQEINEAITSKDLPRLRRLTLGPSGLVETSVRQRAWPLLLEASLPHHFHFRELIKKHKDWTQVQLDVNRAYNFLPTSPKKSLVNRIHTALEEIIHAILSRNPFLHYYQGFHDVCLVFLLVLGEDLGFVASERVAVYYLRDAMSHDLELVVQLLSLIYPLLENEDQELHLMFKEIDLKPYFALSWVITWFSHDIDTRADVERIFDFLLASHPLMPIYLSTAIILEYKAEIMELDRDPAIIHSFMSKLMKRSNHDFDRLILIADRLFRLNSPQKLQKSSGLSLARHSCMNHFSAEWPDWEKKTEKALKEGEHPATWKEGAKYALFAFSATASAMAAVLLTEFFLRSQM